MKQHVLKDSGQRQEFSTGAVRDSEEGKGRFDLLSPFALFRMALIGEKGGIKYNDRNWEKGIPMSRMLDSAIRHLNQYRMGMRDEDHLAQAMWNCHAAIHMEEMVERGVLPAELMNAPNYLEQEEKSKKNC